MTANQQPTASQSWADKSELPTSVWDLRSLHKGSTLFKSWSLSRKLKSLLFSGNKTDANGQWYQYLGFLDMYHSRASHCYRAGNCTFSALPRKRAKLRQLQTPRLCGVKICRLFSQFQKPLKRLTMKGNLFFRIFTQFIGSPFWKPTVFSQIQWKQALKQKHYLQDFKI